jgi:hypothetical protein
MLVCGAVVLVRYFVGWVVAAAIVMAIGVGVLVWAVLTRR